MQTGLTKLCTIIYILYLYARRLCGRAQKGSMVLKAYTANIPQRLAALLLCAALLLPAFGGAAPAARAEGPAPGQSYTQPEGDISTPATAAGEEGEATATAGADGAAADAGTSAPAAPAVAARQAAVASVPGDTARNGARLTITIANLTGPTQVYQPGETPSEEHEKHNIQFQFQLTCNEVGGFQPGDTITVPTNLGELFSVENDDWSYLSDLSVWGDATGETVYAHVKVEPDTVTFTVAEDAVGQLTMQGTVTIPANLIGKNVGATPDQPVTKTLTIGDQTWNIEFLQEKEKEPESGGTSNNPGFPDVDRFWKNYWSLQVNGAPSNGASATIEVNPIGSLDLYGSTTYPQDGPRYPSRPVSYKNFVVEDTIPENGHIDLDSVYISASIPHLMKAAEDLNDKWHGDEITVGGYDVPAGTYYAQRAGTGRPSIKNRMTQLTQEPGETLDAFRERIKSRQLQWGVYYGEPDPAYPGEFTETLICNLGNIGDPDDNNGILYKDFDEKGKAYAADYPEIFGDEGVTGGNVVSYYIEFKTYFTSPGQAHNVSNYGSWKADSARREGHDSTPWTNGGNTGACQIGEYRSFGSVAAKNLVLRLVDADFPDQPIGGAHFKLQQKDSAGNWVDTKLAGTTSSEGYLSMAGLVPGDYKLVQTTSAEGYLFGEDTYNADPAAIGTNLPVKENGEFTVSASDTKGFATVVTNRQVIDLAVTKVWADNDDQDGKRPDSVTVRLLQNGQQVPGKALTLKKADGWQGTFTGLPKYESGKEIPYTVAEDAVTGYTPEVTGTMADGFTITNTHTPEKVALTLTKVWDDDNDRDGLRPQSAEIIVLADGEPTGTVELTADDASADDANVWTRTVEYPANKAGQALTYTVAENTVPGYEEPAISGDAETGFTVTNKHTPAPEPAPDDTPDDEETTPAPDDTPSDEETAPAPDDTSNSTESAPAPSTAAPAATPAPAPQPEPTPAPQPAAVIPQTGDTAPVGLWAALAIAAAAALAGLLFYRYKKNK